MFDLPGPLGTLANFLVIAIGFGSIIFVHELGHFVAAKWAGIRVLAFSIGFGNVLVSYRKGLGFRKGSSDFEYSKLSAKYGDDNESDHPEVSPTEYRLSMLPLGGYVKMLGQEDLNPEATSEAPDSYQNCPVGKRMVVICAGVVMNVIMAATLFIIVFMAGLKVSPTEIGYVYQDSPAANAVSISHPELTTGLLRGDRIISVNGNTMHSYQAIIPEIAMGSKSKPATLMIEREGIEGEIEFQATPVKGEQLGLLEIGIASAISPKLKVTSDAKDLRLLKMSFKSYGFDHVEPGDEFVSANGKQIDSPFDLLDLAKESNGAPFSASIDRNGEAIELTLNPVTEMQADLVEIDDRYSGLRHILGLAGVLMVNPNASTEDVDQGLMPGDIFARIGTLEYPSQPEGIALIQASKGKQLDLIVLRKDESGMQNRVKLTVKVSPKGTIGFYPSQTTAFSNLISKPATFSRVIESDDEPEDALKTEPFTFPATNLIESSGTRIIALGDSTITTLQDVQSALFDSTNAAYQEGDETFTVSVTLQLPLPIQPNGSIPTTTTDWTLTRADIDAVRELGWTLSGSLAIVDLFDIAQVIDKADGPIDAISRGVSESRRVMLQTYITFLRLFEGSVKVEHLKGPVGIAHIGTQIASQGWVWVLFFMALISINLAVINFLPLPIVDGGQFLMLVYEWLRGKPVPILFQNVTTMAGLLMIGTIFLYVTFNDVKALFGV